MTDNIDMGMPDSMVAGFEIFKNLDTFADTHIDLIEFVSQVEVLPVFAAFLQPNLCGEHAGMTVENIIELLRPRMEQQLNACRRFTS